MEKEEFLRILHKYRSGQASAEEERFLHSYYDLFDASEGPLGELSPFAKEELKNSIRAELHARMAATARKPAGKRRLYIQIAAAAAILMVVSLSLYLYFDSRPVPMQANSGDAGHRNNDVAPGGNKAVLTLADGSAILLDEAGNGTLAEQAGTEIRKTQEGTVVYNSRGATSGGKGSMYNTVSTPRGGEYHLILPDGTGVWLNAASSIRFPAVFGSSERKVELTGEAYFEVAKLLKDKNAALTDSRSDRVPFIVKTAEQEVEVLGTHFNINAYTDEGETKTALLEGAVRVSATEGSIIRTRILSPGQQAVLRHADHSLSVGDADLEKAVAWKNGYFRFDRESIQAVMRQVSRWYDVDVEYRGKIPADEFVGKISRNEHVSGVLRILELSNVKCRVEGKKIIIGIN